MTDFGKERIDLRKLIIMLFKRLWIIIAATIVGAIIGILAYMGYSYIKSGNSVYQIRNDYYIYFNYADFDNAPDYYNAFTWDSILRDDPIVNVVMENISNVNKKQIIDSVLGEMLGDYRILTVIVRGTDSQLVQKISDAYKAALPNFAEKIDMLEKIELWTDASIEEYDAYTRELNAAFLGGLIGLMLSIFGVMLIIITDNHIYNEQDWSKRYPDIPWLGKEGSEEYKLNYDYIIGNDNYVNLDIADFSFNATLFEEMRTSKGIIIGINNKIDGELINKAIKTMIKQGIKIVGVKEI